MHLLMLLRTAFLLNLCAGQVQGSNLFQLILPLLSHCLGWVRSGGWPKVLLFVMAHGFFWKKSPCELYSPSYRIGSSGQGFGKLIYVAAFTGESLVADDSVPCAVIKLANERC